LEAFQKFLSSLNPHRAFRLFIFALVFSAILIFAGWGKPYSPSLPVFIYGLLLVVSQEYYYVQLGPTVKDSPYFLGFILTLVEIVDILLVGFPQENTNGFLFKEVGAAILTTVAGLFMRQILLASDPSEETQDRIFRTIAEEVRKDTVEFHNTQTMFVKLIREFVQTREQMFSEEEKAFAQYIKAFKDSSVKLANLPKRAESLLGALEDSGSRISQIVSALETGLNEAADSYRRDVDNVRGSFIAAREQFNAEATSLGKTLNTTIATLNDYASKLSQTASSSARISEDLGNSVSGLSAQIGSVHDRIEHFATDLGRIASDLKAIDQIVDELVIILRDKLLALRTVSQNERPI
jgi:hypothetical protein